MYPKSFSLNQKQTDSLKKHGFCVATVAGIKSIRFNNFIMLDWDTPHRGEVYQNLAQYCHENPQELWAIYDTFAGVHAFRLNYTEPPTSAYSIALAYKLDADIRYVELCIARNLWSARIAPKPHRSRDFICFKGFLGSGIALPKAQWLLQIHHNLLIKHGLTTATKNSPISSLLRQIQLVA
ncbi:hypothetical protein [[Phormidium] sp. LEGE 05292]|uniref:hypothetical protein n=1 Tax=[Phormidium] sp. LEGE 05292 TaxID=767427 RepID=UPI00187EC5A7|nr:hypothetical protein [Phormidium sp. LEGE 05292]